MQKYINYISIIFFSDTYPRKIKINRPIYLETTNQTLRFAILTALLLKTTNLLGY